jgi:heat-inducible transcriptional repressor
MQMDDRKRRILRAIIDDYILTGIPVGSRTISKKYETGLSSATIRNEMSDLEELGFLDQPHVSAGRIPSAKAYRLYVDSLLQDGVIPDDSAESVISHFSGRIHQMEDVIDHAARVLSSLTQYTAVVLSPKGMEPRLQTIQLVPVSSGSALVVIVTDQGVIRDSVIHISPEMSDDTLYAISRRLTNELRGCTLSDACKVLPDMLRRMEGNDEILRGLYGYFTEGQQTSRNPHVAVGGTSNMLSYPEYSDVDKARSFLSLMETRDKLAEIVRGNGELAFTVRIGPETGVPEMADCSIVTATYSTRGGQQGTIGVIGPTRMRYSRVISILNMMGHQLTDMFNGEDEGHPSRNQE